jgi:hypothetical protein
MIELIGLLDEAASDAATAGAQQKVGSYPPATGPTPS